MLSSGGEGVQGNRLHR